MMYPEGNPRLGGTSRSRRPSVIRAVATRVPLKSIIITTITIILITIS